MFKVVSFLLLLSLILTILACDNNTVESYTLNLNKGWKFKTGDNIDFADQDFDDSDWQGIGVDKTWNKQGYKKYEGFAWYRIKVIIPSDIKESASLKDSLILNLGKIDDFDQVFLNGVFIGENTHNIKRGTAVRDDYKDLKYTYWDVPRRYSLAADDSVIRWDRENQIAIRVFDWGVAGGIFSGGLNISMPSLRDYLVIDIQAGEFGNKNQKLGKQVRVINRSAGYTISGEFKIEVHDNITEKNSYERITTLELLPNEKKEFKFDLIKPKESTSLNYEFSFADDSRTVSVMEGIPYILTPPAGDEPRINGPKIYGERSDKPFLFRIAATGKRPIRFQSEKLPQGLFLDEESGIITGKVHDPGKYEVLLAAQNKQGIVKQTLEIIIGDKLALTPPMGWNSWNCWGLSVTQEKILVTARVFVETGLADHGWTYINIDDGWEIKGDSETPKRSRSGEISTNEKFPDMKKLGDDIHSLGLKYGIYSSPGDLTCGGYTGSYQHEHQDAETFAGWGIDYLKYDLCGYRKIMKDQYDPGELIPPYQLMNEALKDINRDIIFSICEYGNGKVWEWGSSVGGNLWRTTGDIWDDWERLYQIGFGQVEAAKYAGPGHWNDPDMLVIGWVGWGPNLHQTELSPDEQYTHVSLWALLSAPLLLGNDMSRLDDFTLNLITNDEVIAIDQDKLGEQALPVIKKDYIEVWKKNLYDGNMAFGIFNVGDQNMNYVLELEKLGLTGEITLRDVWRNKNIGKFNNNFEVRVPAHGVFLVKTSR